MGGTGRFVVFVLVSFVLFLTVLRWVLRKRDSRHWLLLIALAIVVVIGGMVLARWGQHSGMQWWIYYTVPALATLLLPPALLRMSRRETLAYLVPAVLMPPAIHIFFAFFVGWSDYMPFISVPSLSNLLER
jgi:peptidoglycan/LPS O-acetylase OafA/YrhL